MKTVLITGGSRGIGRACVELFLKEGYRVAFIYHHSKEAADALEKLGAVGFQGDLSSMEECKRVADCILERFGGVDILINNAGVALFSLATYTSDEEWARVRAVNLDAPFLLCRAFLPHMINKKEGRIINVSSMWGQVGASCEVAYSAAKAGVIGLTKALAKEVGPSGITVNCIAPGVIDTDMNARLSQEDRNALVEETPMGRLGSAAEVAELCLYLAGAQASFITGQVFGINGGLVIV
ncbi:MAG: 3-oxoacyl-ACP reductase FabG [Clostridia bacterium]|nr:3-oxoacyl-ACP reductase FabG [Clostridia bacterium]MBQ8235527.1 3-oxoacyl-ACP reductase FabG [Clostridia bacterium]MBQ8400100.1 3-oxoacyl-ACP reductase FabG [Clostridia bacterium]